MGEDGEISLFKDFANDKDGYQVSMIALGNDLFFLQDDQTTPPRASLWRTDGSSAGTQVVFSDLSSSRELTAVGSQLFFSGVDLSSQAGVWQTDGTPGGTSRILFPTNEPA